MSYKVIRKGHEEVGGVTNQSRRIVIVWEDKSQLLSSIDNVMQVERVHNRSMFDLIVDHSRVQQAKEVFPTSDEIKSFDGKVLIDDDLLGKFVVPSIWAKSGWVERSLTDYEVMNMMDVTQLRRPLIVSQLSVLIKEGDLTPGKLCQLVFEMMSSLYAPPIRSDEEVPRNKPELLMMGVETSAIDNSWEMTYLKSYGQRKAKEDDAPVPIELWDRRCLQVISDDFDDHLYHTKWAKTLNWLREKAMNRYRRNVTFSFLNYLRSTYGSKWFESKGHNLSLDVDLKVGRDAVRRAVNSTWWEWTEGSTLFYWRWPQPFQLKARDGVLPFVEYELPENKSPQRLRGLTRDQLDQMMAKLLIVCDKGYIEGGFVKCLTNYFAVPKGDNDIRMVYDGTKCGLNDALFSPNFFLPSLDSLFNQIGVNYWFSDFDLGEMFLNYSIHPSMRPYCGVDLTQIFGGGTPVWKRWCRTYMGWTFSPYADSQMFSISMDVVKGNPRDINNPYRWDSIKRNLPGMENYDPSEPWVIKMDGPSPAADADVYVDDGRPFGPTRIACLEAGRRAAQLIQYLGQQVAARKYIPPSLAPGPWCGAFIASHDQSLWAYVSDDKWNKGRRIIQELFDLVVVKGGQKLEHKKLEKDRGFLVHLGRTYPSIIPYLKGIHLTLESWRDDRDSLGWKRKEREFIFTTEGDELPVGSDDSRIPKEVNIVPRLGDDLTVLNNFFTPESSPWRFIRGKLIAAVQYGFGDASKAGFGASIGLPGGDVWVRAGTWESDDKASSSNYRELGNLVHTLETRAEQNLLRGLEIFFFTDNSSAEGCFYKGTSSSKKLFELIVRLRKLELHQGCKIHFIHVAGTRMIAQGTDGISRGDMQEGVLSGASMLSFVPLHLTCLERCSLLRSWIDSWVPKGSNYLGTEDWFVKAHNITGWELNGEKVWIPKYASNVFIWTPAPAEGMIAVEQLRRARTKHTDSTHVFVIPRLFTSLWRKQLNKVSDVVFQLPFNDIWSESQFEPLVVAFVFPFISSRPWQLKRSNAFLGMDRYLRRMLCQNTESQGDILRQLFESQRELATLSESLAWEVLQDTGKFFDICAETRRRLGKRLGKNKRSGSVSMRKKRR